VPGQFGFCQRSGDVSLVHDTGTDYNVIFWLNIVVVSLKSKLQYKRSVINKLRITLGLIVSTVV